VFNLPVRRGLPVNLKGMPEPLMKPMYATAAGLILHARAESVGAKSNGRHGRLGKFKTRVSGWMREFF
jgi:cell division ATPase FtsA